MFRAVITSAPATLDCLTLIREKSSRILNTLLRRFVLTHIDKGCGIITSNVLSIIGQYSFINRRVVYCTLRSRLRPELMSSHLVW